MVRFQLRFCGLSLRLQMGERCIDVFLLCSRKSAGFSVQGIERFLPGFALGFGPRLESLLQLLGVMPCCVQILLSKGFERGPISFQSALRFGPTSFALHFVLLNGLLKEIALRAAWSVSRLCRP